MHLLRYNGDLLADAGEAVAPDLIKEDSGFDVAEAVFGNFTMAAFGEHRVDVSTSHAVCFGGFDTESFAVEIEIETARRAVASADAVEGELFGEVAVWFGLVTVTEPIFARDWDVEESRTEINKGDVEPASVEGDDCLIMSGDLPKVS